MIVDKCDNIVSRPPEKFWNLNEAPGPAFSDLPNEDPIITLKEDGYLGVSYWFGSRVYIASRGSFTSEYAAWATNWFRNHNPYIDMWLGEHSGITYVFEILHPKRIVVDNSQNIGLVLLAGVVTETGAEIDRNSLEIAGNLMNCKVVQQYPTHTIDDCVIASGALKGTEQEGFVAYYPKSGLRVKIKGEDYCKIHRIATKLTKRRIWEIYASHGGDTHLADCELSGVQVVLPKEYADWIDRTAFALKAAWNVLFYDAIAAKDAVCPQGLPWDGYNRKDVVQRLQAEFPDIWHEALYLIDGSIDKAVASIWRRLKPEHEVPLLQDGEDE